ncbi:MAG: universal stress protein [Thiotrichales bacterium]
MNRFKNILVVCNPESSHDAPIARALELARRNNARATVLAVTRETPGLLRYLLESAESRAALQAELVERDRQRVESHRDFLLANGIEADARVAIGVEFLEIIRTVIRDGHDLVMVHVDGGAGLRARLVTSTTMHLMRKCPCPVWVVKPVRRKKYARILAAVDVTEGLDGDLRQSLNDRILGLASDFARMDGSELHVVQAWSVYGEGYMEVRGNIDAHALERLRQQTRQLYLDRLTELLQPYDPQGETINRHLSRGEPAEIIIQLAHRLRVDLLIMGTVCRTGVAGFLIGNTAEKVLSEIKCSVLTLKPEGFQSPVTLDQ